MQKKKMNVKMSHVQIIALGFFLIIMTGTILLMLPVSTKNGQGASFLDAVFVDGIGVSIFVPVLCAVGFSPNMVSARFF